MHVEAEKNWVAAEENSYCVQRSCSTTTEKRETILKEGGKCNNVCLVLNIQFLVIVVTLDWVGCMLTNMLIYGYLRFHFAYMNLDATLI